MKERQPRGEQQPERKKSYPESVGNDLYSRRLFDIGVEAGARLYAEPGDYLNKDVVSKNARKFSKTANLLFMHINDTAMIPTLNEVEPIKNQMWAEAARRGLIPDIATLFGLMPFVHSPESISEYLDNHLEFSDELIDVVAKEVDEELKKPMYPEAIAESEKGRKIFDKGVASMARRENHSWIKIFPERAAFTALRLEHKFPGVPASSGTRGSESWYGYMYEEALNRGLIKEKILEKDRERRIEKELKEMLGGVEQKPPKKGILFRKKKEK